MILVELEQFNISENGGIWLKNLDLILDTTQGSKSTLVVKRQYLEQATMIFAKTGITITCDGIMFIENCVWLFQLVSLSVFFAANLNVSVILKYLSCNTMMDTNLTTKTQTKSQHSYKFSWIAGWCKNARVDVKTHEYRHFETRKKNGKNGNKNPF